MATTKKHMQQATQAIQAGDFQQAAQILEGLVNEQPGNFQARWVLMRTLEQLGNFEQAQLQLVELLRLATRELGKLNRLAAFVRQRGYALGPVIDAYRKFLERTPASALGTYNYAYYLGCARQVDAAVENYLRAIELGIKAPEEAHLNIGNLYMDVAQDNDKAREQLEKAIALNPDYAQAYFNLGNLEEREGHREAAQNCFSRCLELDPKNDFALARLADASRFDTAEDALISRMAERSGESKNIDLHFALGRAYDQVENYEKAWPELVRANELDRAQHNEYKQSRSEAVVQRIQSVCNSEWLSQFGGDSHSTVFVCGMFRSGSTLVEQILSAHPSFTAGGESEFFPRLVGRNFRGFPEGLERLDPDVLSAWRSEHAALSDHFTGGETRFIDKRPDNFLYAGLIKAVLPAAKFVVTERDWRDMAVSVFSTRLAPSQAYATRLEDIGHYLGLHRELIDHWEKVMGDDLMRVEYESLIANPRETIGAVLDFLGEPWDDACLEFDKHERSVGTASVWQVRQPLNPKSIGRWQNYQGPLREVFGSKLEN